MQRRIGQHDADGVVAGRNRVGKIRLRATLKNHDGPARTFKRDSIRLGHDTKFLYFRQVTRHDGKRLVAATLSVAELPHSRIILRVTGQQKTAQPFHSDESSRVQQIANALQGSQRRPLRCTKIAGDRQIRFGIMLAAFDQRQTGAAGGTGIGLGVKSAISGVFIFGVAKVTHAKLRHGGSRAIVRNILNDRVARPAIGAVGEWVAVAAVGRIAKVTPAIVAGGYVRGDEGERVLLLATGLDGKFTCILQGNFFQRDLHNLGQGGWAGPQGMEKLLDRVAGTLDFNRNAGGGIQDKARQLQRSGQVVDEGTEADSLHHSSNRDALADSRERAGCGHGRSWAARPTSRTANVCGCLLGYTTVAATGFGDRKKRGMHTSVEGPAASKSG